MVELVGSVSWVFLSTRVDVIFNDIKYSPQTTIIVVERTRRLIFLCMSHSELKLKMWRWQLDISRTIKMVARLQFIPRWLSLVNIILLHLFPYSLLMSSDIPIWTTGFGGRLFVSLRAYAVVVSSTTNIKRTEIFNEEAGVH